MTDPEFDPVSTQPQNPRSFPGTLLVQMLPLEWSSNIQKTEPILNQMGHGHSAPYTTPF